MMVCRWRPEAWISQCCDLSPHASTLSQCTVDPRSVAAVEHVVFTPSCTEWLKLSRTMHQTSCCFPPASKCSVITYFVVFFIAVHFCAFWETLWYPAVLELCLNDELLWSGNETWSPLRSIDGLLVWTATVDHQIERIFLLFRSTLGFAVSASLASTLLTALYLTASKSWLWWLWKKCLNICESSAVICFKSRGHVILQHDNWCWNEFISLLSSDLRFAFRNRSN